MQKFKEGSIIIKKSGERRKVIGVCGDVRFLETVGEEKLYTPSTYSVTNLEDRGYVEEAPRWEPSFPFWYVASYGEVECSRGRGDNEYDSDLLKTYASFNNCFPTREAAQAARERVKKALRGE